MNIDLTLAQQAIAAGFRLSVMGSTYRLHDKTGLIVREGDRSDIATYLGRDGCRIRPEPTKA